MPFRRSRVPLHRGGKIEVDLSVPLNGRDDLSMAYTPRCGPGLHRDRRPAGTGPRLHLVANTVAVVSDGTAVLGLEASAPSPRCR